MSNVKNWVKFQFPALPENVAFARACAAAFAAQLDCTLDEMEEIKVVVSEAVSNSIIHGYEGRSDGIIQMELKLIKERLVEIIVEDHGRGIADIEKALQPAFSTVPERMGMGFVFIKSFMDDVEVQSSINQGTRITMHKTFTPVGNS